MWVLRQYRQRSLSAYGSKSNLRANDCRNFYRATFFLNLTVTAATVYCNGKSTAWQVHIFPDRRIWRWKDNFGSVPRKLPGQPKLALLSFRFNWSTFSFRNAKSV